MQDVEGVANVFAGVGLTKTYDSRVVFQDLSFSTSLGRALVIKGPNGSGKTTLLRCLLGGERLDAGYVVVNDEPLQTSGMGYWSQVYGVLDDFSWFPDLTIQDHLRLHDPGADTDSALAHFGIAGLGARRASSLSSGQLRRAALATALVRPWTVLLLDEPEQRLDPPGLEQLLTAIEQFLDARRIVLLSTHLEGLQAKIPSDVLTLGEAE